jgi:hypothetical protein
MSVNKMKRTFNILTTKSIFILDLHFVYPLGKPMIPHLLRCQGFAVAYYSFTLDALDLGQPQLSLN